MGATTSRSADANVFKLELSKLNTVVNSIINEKDVFKSSKYNFLSQDVCNQYQVILEEELHKHLKISIKSLGTSLYLIPKNEESKLTRFNITKKEVCEKISTHYIKILYILTLIKYVYNIEKHGDMSIAGIVFRNIRVLDDVMEINFCDAPHKNYSAPSNDKKQMMRIDFSHLEGFKFFVEFFLDKKEAHGFLAVMRAILAREPKRKVEDLICSHKAQDRFTPQDLKFLEQTFEKKFGAKLKCKAATSVFKTNRDIAVTMDLFINKDNPIFSSNFCFSPRKIIIKTNTVEGKKVLHLYQLLKANYNGNIARVTAILDRLVSKKSDGSYQLIDVDKVTLDGIIEDIKLCIKAFYLQSMVDFQKILDQAKVTPNIVFT